MMRDLNDFTFDADGYCASCGHHREAHSSASYKRSYDSRCVMCREGWVREFTATCFAKAMFDAWRDDEYQHDVSLADRRNREALFWTWWGIANRVEPDYDEIARRWKVAADKPPIDKTIHVSRPPKGSPGLSRS